MEKPLRRIWTATDNVHHVELGHGSGEFPWLRDTALVSSLNV